jgi:hypothetical protein
MPGGLKSSGIGRGDVRFAVAAMSDPERTIVVPAPQLKSTVNCAQ